MTLTACPGMHRDGRAGVAYGHGPCMFRFRDAENTQAMTIHITRPLPCNAVHDLSRRGRHILQWSVYVWH
jgi:hypothetical protein